MGKMLSSLGGEHAFDLFYHFLHFDVAIEGGITFLYGDAYI